MPLERLMIRTVAEVFSYDEKIQSKIVELLTELEFANLAVLKIKLSSRNKDDIFLDAFNGFNQKLFSGRGVGRWHKNVIKVSGDSSNTFFILLKKRLTTNIHLAVDMEGLILTISFLIQVFFTLCLL